MFPDHVMNLLRKRYLQKGETPEDMFARVARYIALVDLLYLPEVYQKEPTTKKNRKVSKKLIDSISAQDYFLTHFELGMLVRAFNRINTNMKVSFSDFLKVIRKHLSFDVLPSQVDFYNIISALDFLPSSPVLMNSGCRTGQLLACFVLPVGDSVHEIFEVNSIAARIYQSGGGAGFSMKHVRSYGELTSNGYSASGPIPFMLVPAATIESIKQGGARKGAAMVSLPVDHPDILEFITCKENDQHKLFNNFNISVAITDAFWEAYLKDKFYDLIDPHSNQVKKRLRARDVFEKITEHAHKTGDPGVFFIDRINAFNPTPQLGEIETCNPCGEIFGLPYEACDLGSINLSNFVLDRGGSPHFDFERFIEVTQIATHFLDNVLDASNYPDSRIEDLSMCNRKIGLGVMGLADCLAKLHIPYDDPTVPNFVSEIMKTLSYTSRSTSVDLACERGTFKSYDYERLSNIYSWDNVLDKAIKQYGLRNASITAIAPTGTLSIIAQCGSSIEPYFKVRFERKDETGTYVVEYPTFTSAKEKGWYSPTLFKEAHEINPGVRIQIVSAFQKYTDNSISQTINLANEVSIDTVRRVFEDAYAYGCKCMTVFRDRSLESQVLNTIDVSSREPRKRPEVLTGQTVCVELTQGKLYVTMNEDVYGLREVIVNLGKGGTDSHANAEAAGRQISNQCKWWVPIDSVVNQLLNIQGTESWSNGVHYKSVHDAVAQVLRKFYLDNNVEIKAERIKVCDVCGSARIVQTGHCYNCIDCGHTPCT